LATIFAKNRFNLVLVARNEMRLNKLADELRAAHKIEVAVLPQDLTRPGAASEIFRRLEGTDVSVLVNNAGFGAYGAFAHMPLDTQSEMIQLNIMSLMQLTHLFVQPMLVRHAGRVMNVASTAAFQPGPMMNVYYASKAFVYSFSYALADELAGTGVTVTALCPGMTPTEFQERARVHMGGLWPMTSPRAVAEAGYRGLMKGKRVVIPGILNQIGAFVAKRSPGRLTNAIVRRIHQP
jgi:short-subunit dehydrogenase